MSSARPRAQPECWVPLSMGDHRDGAGLPAIGRTLSAIPMLAMPFCDPSVNEALRLASAGCGGASALTQFPVFWVPHAGRACTALYWRTGL